MTCEFLSRFSWPLSFLFWTLLHSRGQRVSKWAQPEEHKGAGPHAPQRPQQTDDLHSRQVVHMRKSESVLQLAFNLYLKRQLENKANTGKISITDIHHSEFMRQQPNYICSCKCAHGLLSLNSSIFVNKCTRGRLAQVKTALMGCILIFMFYYIKTLHTL